MKMVVDLRAGRRARAGHGAPHVRLSGARDLRLPLRATPTAWRRSGIFVPSWFGSPVRTAYRYLQHWMLHPYLWRYLKGGTLRSWGAKSLQESGRRGEPYLVGDGYARIGEGLGQHERADRLRRRRGLDDGRRSSPEAVARAARDRAGRSRATNLESTYVRRRRESWARGGGAGRRATRGTGSSGAWCGGWSGMALAGLTGGRLCLPRRSAAPGARSVPDESYFGDRIARRTRSRESGPSAPRAARRCTTR